MTNIISKEKTLINLCGRKLGKLTEYCLSYSCKGFLIGSYSCSNYFEFLLNYEPDLKESCFDLVVPIMPEHKLKLLYSKSFQRLCEKSKSVVVNDFGTLDLINGQYPFRLGRMFFREYRDHRYPEYDSREYHSKYNELISFLEGCGFKINAIESDILSKNFFPDIDENIDVYYHYPFRQISACRICEFASAGKSLTEKFIPDDSCAMECHNSVVVSSSGHLKVGRNVFDCLDNSYLSCIHSEDHIILMHQLTLEPDTCQK